MELVKLLKSNWRVWTWLAMTPLLMALAGCATSDDLSAYGPIPDPNAPPSASAMTDTTNYTLRVGDSVTVTFYDLATPIQPITDEIKEDGTITLIQNEQFKAAGLTISQLQTAVHDRYVPAYYHYMTVNIVPANRFYTVSGEVKSEGHQPYPGHMTVLEAIASAGGFTDYARKRKVTVTRAGSNKQITVNCIKALDHPELNIEVFPGDTVHVPHTIF
jgi:protein involved in polysaccharide export with SLBB domain